MSTPSRIIIAVASLALISTYFLPVWFIFLIAPQYPEGLTMQIWLNKMTGQIDIINGLNHYIGMKAINAEMFPEFDYLVYIVAFYIAFGLLVAITGKRRLLFTYILLTFLGAAAAMYDFYLWGKDYGSNLDPKAAIKVPGLTYQPPVIGHKTLLNFDAYSLPDVGGWIVIAAGAIIVLVWVFEFFKNRNRRAALSVISNKRISVAAAIVLLALSACNTKPEPFAIGKDICEECNMIIMDPKFGGELITKKGKVLKFDDAHCIDNYLKKGYVKEADIAQTVSIDYENNKNFLDVKSSYFVVSDQLKSPMNSNAASFSTKESAEKKAKESNGSVKTWDELRKKL